MSDLQISLLVIGLVVVAGVYLYNWFQERRLRRSLERAFGETDGDALLEDAAPAGERVEPQLASAFEETEERDDIPVIETPTTVSPPPVPVQRSAPPPADDFDYVAELECDTPIGEAILAELLSKAAECGKPCAALGFVPATGEWEEVGRSGASRYTVIRLAVQLVNRSGPLGAAQLGTLCDAVRICADKARAQVTLPDTEAALDRARKLDAFCAEVDVAIGINVVAGKDVIFAAPRIRSLAEAAGFKLESDGVFHFRDEHRNTLFTLDNHEPSPFLPEKIQTLTTRGVTLLLDVPRVAGAVAVLDRMIQTARDLAQSLGGRVVDDNRVPLNDAGINSIRQQLTTIHAAMQVEGIEPGSSRAQRLFS